VSVEAPQKVSPRHLRRSAYLYVRQSSMRQVFENRESTKRQYALRQRAVALGWPQDQIIVIDSDQGQSGASANEREGFQQLVAEVGLGHAGLVMGLEVSRLARNSTDWHRLLEICALSDTLILDEDGLYDPSHFNDRLLLGLKGTMSEAELHVLRTRLRGGILSKARRGELWSSLPIGLVYHPDGHVILDPDAQVQESLQHFFRTFRRAGSAMATVKAFRAEDIRFPRRIRAGIHKGDLAWGELTHWRALWILHNPRYAGAFFFGRTRRRKGLEGRERFEKLPREEWVALLPGAHPGYISWEEFEENQRRLQENSAAHGGERRRSPPREGPALLQGLVVCGRCGDRMTVRYRDFRGTRHPEYVCQRRGIAQGISLCERIPGTRIDEAVGQLLLDLVTPLTLEVALSVERELQARFDEADQLRRQHVERARYEAEVARRRYMKVDPDNRLVADELECEWNQKLRAFTEAQEQYEMQKKEHPLPCDEEQRRRIMALATDFPRLWNDCATSHRDRKRAVRLLIEDVTLNRGEKAIEAHVRLRGGTTQTLGLPLPQPAWALRKTSSEVVAEVDRLLDHHTHTEIARILNDRGLCSGDGRRFHRMIVHRIQKAYGLKPRYDRLREAGMLTLEEIASQLGLCTATVKIWRRNGLLRARAYNDKNESLYEPPSDAAPVKYKWKGISAKKARRRVVPHTTNEVQCEP
jgi:DNA invertase Pin-like site-specific DNA recombinase